MVISIGCIHQTYEHIPQCMKNMNTFHIKICPKFYPLCGEMNFIFMTWNICGYFAFKLCVPVFNHFGSHVVYMDGRRLLQESGPEIISSIVRKMNNEKLSTLDPNPRNSAPPTTSRILISSLKLPVLQAEYTQIDYYQ